MAQISWWYYNVISVAISTPIKITHTGPLKHHHMREMILPLMRKTKWGYERWRLHSHHTSPHANATTPVAMKTDPSARADVMEMLLSLLRRWQPDILQRTQWGRPLHLSTKQNSPPSPSLFFFLLIFSFSPSSSFLFLPPHLSVPPHHLYLFSETLRVTEGTLASHTAVLSVIRK